MRVALDASAAIEIALRRSRTARLAAILAEADVVLAPELFVPEVVHTICKYHRSESLSLDACDRLLQAARGLVDALVPSMEIRAEAFLLARNSRRSAYDMFYLALARREDAALLTTDTALRREAERQGVRVA